MPAMGCLTPRPGLRTAVPSCFPQMYFLISLDLPTTLRGGGSPLGLRLGEELGLSRAGGKPRGHHQAADTRGGFSAQGARAWVHSSVPGRTPDSTRRVCSVPGGCS